jgi:glycosyltransferase involved in cell wall biosynthesis
MDIYECYMKEIRAFRRELTLMRVTILSNSKGGLLTITMAWARGLVRKGCAVNIFFLTRSEEARNLVSSEYMHFYYFTNSFFIPNLRTLAIFLLHDRPDVVHINIAWFGPLAIFKKHVMKIPFIFTSHGVPQPWLEPSLLYRIAYTIEHYLLRVVAFQSSVVVAVSNYVKETLKKQYGIDSEVIYHGIDADKFKPKNKAESKKTLGFKETDFVALFVGKMHPVKDPLTVVKSIHEVVKKNTNVYLAMIGSGELFHDIENAIIKLNLSRHVRMLGQMHGLKLKLWYNAADLFVFASVSEAFGMVLLEAMASGLPIIAPSSAACPEVVGNAGLLFNNRDYNGLAREIMRLASDNKLAKILGSRSLRRATEVFSWDDKVDKYLRLYEETAGEALHCGFYTDAIDLR